MEILPNGIAVARRRYDVNVGFHDDGILIQENPVEGVMSYTKKMNINTIPIKSSSSPLWKPSWSLAWLHIRSLKVPKVVPLPRH